MKIKNISYSSKGNKLVLSGETVLNSEKKHDIYFEVNKGYKNFISKDASPFLAAGLPISMKKNEDLEIDGTVSKSLMTNTSEIMKITHYGCIADKIIKLRFLSNNKLVMENLRVCWVNKKKEYNCCECEKCFRNMLALYISDSLEKCKTFSKSLDLGKLKNTRVSEYCLKYFMAILKAMKLKKDKSQVRAALEECIMNNTNPNFQQRIGRNIRDIIRLIDQKYNRNRLFWYLSAKGFI